MAKWQGSTSRETAANLRALGAPRDLSFGRWCLHLSDADMRALLARYPELDAAQNTDAALRSKAWHKWMKSSASEPYRVQPRAKL